MSTDFDSEQKAIVEKISELLKPCTGKEKQGQRWGKFKGDVVCRVIQHYISRRLLSNGLEVVGPSVFIDGYKLPWEFDLATVKAGAKPPEYRNAYRAVDIRNVLEIKAYGIIAKGSEYKEVVRKRVRRPFEDVRNKYPDIEPVYLAIRETEKPVSPNALRYAEMTRQALTGYKVFILQDARTGDIQYGQWEAFIQCLNTTQRGKT